MAVDSKEIGRRIKEIRKDNGMTQQQFADRIGISLNALSKIEPGMRTPSIDLFVVISESFGVSLDYLVLGK